MKNSKDQPASQVALKACIKLALEYTGHDYAWLAEQCGVKEVTFRNWMAKKNIAEERVERILALFPGIDAVADVLDKGMAAVVTNEGEAWKRLMAAYFAGISTILQK